MSQTSGFPARKCPEARYRRLIFGFVAIAAFFFANLAKAEADVDTTAPSMSSSNPANNMPCNMAQTAKLSATASDDEGATYFCLVASCGVELSDEPGDLGRRQPGDPGQIPLDQTPFGLAQGGVVKPRRSEWDMSV
jgi:hypothetical protein